MSSMTSSLGAETRSLEEVTLFTPGLLQGHPGLTHAVHLGGSMIRWVVSRNR